MSYSQAVHIFRTRFLEADRKTIHEGLKQMVETGVNDHSYGICGNLGLTLESTMPHWEAQDLAVRFCRQLSPMWFHYSGDTTYPVPGKGLQSSKSAYVLCKDKWDPATDYGNLRVQLLHFLLAVAQEGQKPDETAQYAGEVK